MKRFGVAVVNWYKNKLTGKNLCRRQERRFYNFKQYDKAFVSILLAWPSYLVFREVVVLIMPKFYHQDLFSKVGRGFLFFQI